MYAQLGLFTNLRMGSRTSLVARIYRAQGHPYLLLPFEYSFLGPFFRLILISKLGFSLF